jgi:hypothetical protein
MPFDRFASFLRSILITDKAILLDGEHAKADDMVENRRLTRKEWLRVRGAANTQLRDFGVLDAPVPVTAMARRQGLTLRYADFPHDENVSGFIDAKSKSIVVNAAEPPSRQMFTIAHELGHWLMHRQQVMDDRQYRVLTREALDAPKPLIEKEADGFAADLLVPKFLLDKYYENAPVRPSRASLARIFGVSEDVIRYRLKSIYGD